MKECPFCAETIQDAAIVCKHCGRELNPNGHTHKKSKSRLRVGLLLFLLVGFLVWGVLGRESERRSALAALNAPITLTDQVQNVPAASWKAVPLVVPYTGTLDLRLEVLHGNPLDVYLTTEDQVESMRQEKWDDVRIYSAFTGTKTRVLHRTSPLAQGTYYLVMRDTSLGILSARASDVAVKARVTP